jgi:hypothetical protein
MIDESDYRRALAKIANIDWNVTQETVDLVYESGNNNEKIIQKFFRAFEDIGSVILALDPSLYDEYEE